MTRETVVVPDLGGADEVEVIEILVTPGMPVVDGQGLIVLESDKASMEVPAPRAGTLAGVLVQVGQRVRQGDAIVELEIAADTLPPVPAPAAPAIAPEPVPVPGSAPVASVAPAVVPPPAAAADAGTAVLVPDLGGADSVEVIEILARNGDHVDAGATLLVLESDKATMELPAPVAGVVSELAVRVGARVTGGECIARIGGEPVPTPAAPPVAERRARVEPSAPTAVAALGPAAAGDGGDAINRVFEKERLMAAGHSSHREPAPEAGVYAGPGVRQLARELGVPLALVTGSGAKGRIQREDVQAWVRQRVAAPAAVAGSAPTDTDFSAFGTVELQSLNAIQKATVTHMARAWQGVPHVTQFDYADVGDLEEFRASLKPEMDARGVKLSPLPFILLAVARALRTHQRFNASLQPVAQQLVLKRYVHIGIAVDTPQGLLVPVIRDADRKSLWELAAEIHDLAARARARKLKPAEMQGGCFTVTSLGAIGGEGFTPIVNAPEVAILGVSRLAVRPAWDGTAFVPRQSLPLSLSYDHRVINGADAGGFLTTLVALLGDVRRLLL